MNGMTKAVFLYGKEKNSTETEGQTNRGIPEHIELKLY